MYPVKEKVLFQRRHYVAIAKVLWDTKASNDTITSMGAMFEEDNPNFSFTKFFNAALNLD